MLDVLVLTGRKRTEYFRFLLSAWLGRHQPETWIVRRKAAQVKIDGRPGPWVQADGELIGTIRAG